MATAKEAMMDMFLNVNDDVDVTFLVHKTEVKAHRSILSVRSDAFKTMFNFGEQPADGRYPINDPIVSPDVFKEFLKFLYLDECDINFCNLGSLVHMSQMYLVPRLKDRCIMFADLQCTTTIEGAIKIGELGILYEKECPELLRCSLKPLGSPVLDSFYYNTDVGTVHASKGLVYRVAKDSPRIYGVHEDNLFHKIVAWGEQLCKKEIGKVDGETLKEILSEGLRSLKLENLSDDVIIYNIHKKNLLSPEHYIHIVVNRLEFFRGFSNQFANRIGEIVNR